MSSYYASSPTVVLPAPSAQYFAHLHPQHQQQQQQAPTNMPPTNPFTKPQSTTTTTTTISRKRSRDDDDDDAQTLLPNSSLPPPISSTPPKDPTYGPGMTLSYPNDQLGHPASSTGTWVNNTWIAAIPQPSSVSPSRPAMPSRKSQRLAPSAAEPDVTTINTITTTPLPPTANQHPLINTITNLLGISYKPLTSSPALLISRSAYTTFIRRHYPALTRISLWFENPSIPGYLGAATEKATGQALFLLWSNDLKQAVLVTRDENELVEKLLSPQKIVAEAKESMFACDEAVDVSDDETELVASSSFSRAVAATAEMDVD
jgi:hypothetical protein